MHQTVRWKAWLFVILFTGISFGQAQSPRLSLRAASVEPVDGWQTMRVEHCQGERCTMWVSPTAAVTESDIEQGQPEVSPNAASDGGSSQRIRIALTNAGAAKLHELTTAQLRSHIALVVDDKVLWAPLVMGSHNADYNESMLAGNSGRGLTQEEVELIMSILRPTQPR
jgi:preprotein translocase subunit SecD